MAKTRQWKFDGGLTDFVGSADMAAFGGGVSYTPGIFGQAVKPTTNTGGAGVAVGSFSDLNPGANDFSCAGWFYYDGTPPGSNAPLMALWDTASNNRVWLVYIGTSGDLTFAGSSNGTGSTFFRSSSPLSAGIYRVAVSKTGSTYVFNVNGANVVPPFTGDAVLHSAAGTSQFTVLNYQDAGARALTTSWIDNVEYWDEGLTDTQFALQYFASLSTISLEPVSPLPGDTGVSTSAVLDLNVNDSANNLILASTNVYVTRGDLSEEAVYLGGSGYQSPWTGGSPSPGDPPAGDGTGQIQFRNLVRTGGYFEDNDVSVRVESANDVGHTLDETYSQTFEIETVGFVGNSGFEAPGATSVDPKGWSKSGQAERDNSPPLSPPQGTFVMKLLDTHTVGDLGRVLRVTADLTPVAFLDFHELFNYPSIDAGDTINLYVFIDDTQVYNRQLTSADAGISEVNAKRVSTVGYSGTHTITALAVYVKSGEQYFVDEFATAATFDSGTDDKESFDNWTGVLQTFDDEDPGIEIATFDTNSFEQESFDNWPV